MAKQCCVCEKKLSFLDQGIPIQPGNMDAFICEECAKKIRKAENAHSYSEIGPIKQEFLSMISDEKIKSIIEERLSEIENKILSENLSASKGRLIHEKNGDVLITSGYSFEGYKIDKYFGVISVDRLFQSGIVTVSVELKGNVSFGSGGSNSEKKMKKVLDEYIEVKNHVIHDLIDDAKNLNCNGIIGFSIDVDPIGSDVSKVTASGTAVHLIHDAK
ncbi:MAG: heavy metal-binding domain-containing protein [Eubacteriaceae bacterium]|nr:heavy metal-binding domain-containing protein [Eubacteriaceae bacterium]